MIQPECICKEHPLNNGKVSFASVGEQSEWPYKWEKDPVTYSVIRGSDDLAGESIERLMVNLAMTTWDIEIKPRLKWVPISQSPDIRVEWKNQEDDEMFRTMNGVLAYAYFPNTSKSGQIVFNDKYLWGPKSDLVSVTNPDGSISRVKQYNALHTLIHEIGHSIGLLHNETMIDSVMYPFYNGQLNLTQNDIDRIVSKYSAQSWSKWSYLTIKKWLMARKIRF